MEDLKKKYALALSTIKLPVKYERGGQQIWDSNNHLVIDLRGWGYIKYLDTPLKRQDEIGEMIVELMNSLA